MSKPQGWSRRSNLLGLEWGYRARVGTSHQAIDHRRYRLGVGQQCVFTLPHEFNSPLANRSVTEGVRRVEFVTRGVDGFRLQFRQATFLQRGVCRSLYLGER